jgi:hypothetical protein
MQPVNTESNRRGGAAWLAVLALFAVVNVARVTLTSVGHDFYQFWSIGHLAPHDAPIDLYAKHTSSAISKHALREVSGPHGSQRGRRAAAINRQLYPEGVDPISTPTYYALFAALSGDDYDTDLLGFQIASTAMLMIAAWFLCRRVGYSPASTTLALTVLMLVFGPLHADIQTGNTNRMQLALLAAALSLHHFGSRQGFRVAAGVLLGALIVLKPNLAGIPLLLAAVWLADRRFAELRSAAFGWLLGAGATVAVGTLRFSWESWSQWISALAVYQSHPAPISQSNWSSARLIFEWTGADASVLLALSLTVCAATCAWWGRSRASRTSRIDRDITAVGSALLVPLIASQIAWDHYFLLAAPALVVALRPAGHSLTRRVCAGAILCACAVSPLRIAWPEIGPMGLAASLAVGTAGLFALSMLELTHPTALDD